MRKTFASLTALALLCSSVATVAAAQPAARSGDAPRAVVQYSDLNLASASGRAQLAYRISQAAASVCGPQPSIRELGASQVYNACLREAKQTSTPSLDQAAALQVRLQERLAAAGEH